MKSVLFSLALMACANAQFRSVTTVVGTGVGGYSEAQVNNPYGMTMGPDGALYFCDLDNSMIRRLDLATKRMTTIAGNGKKGYAGDGGAATDASLSAPHELLFDAKGDLYIAERDNHVIRKVDGKTHVISTVVGTGVAGFAGDGGPGTKAQMRQPHSIVLDRDGTILICDIGNHRIRRYHIDTGVVETWAGTGEAKSPMDGAPVAGSPLNGPRTMILAPNGDLYLALREGNAVYRIERQSMTIHHVAGTGENGYTGDGGLAQLAKFGGSPGSPAAARLAGPKGLALGSDNSLYIVDTESHAIRKVDLASGVISTVLGTGALGDGPEANPLTCRLNRPHAALFVNGVLYVADSEAHRIRVLK